MKTTPWLLVVWLAGISAALASGSRQELEFEVNSALKTRDPIALVRCFNFQGADKATRNELTGILENIFAWPAYTVSTSDRKEQGRVRLTKGDRNYTLNGEWLFQIHILSGEKGGYVFPAGIANGEYLILLTTPEKN